MLLDINKEFDKILTNIFQSKPEILKFLINHERKMVCINNLAREIHLVRHLKKEHYFQIIKDTAKMFAEAALNAKEQELMSEAEKKNRILKADLERLAKEASQDIEKEATTTTFTSYNK